MLDLKPVRLASVLSQNFGALQQLPGTADIPRGTLEFFATDDSSSNSYPANRGGSLSE